jgi:glycine cleavage system aminomethyltransferase T
VVIADVTSSFGVLNVCGPASRDVVAALSTADFSTAAFPYMSAQRVDIGWAPAIALRATYVGELGWEFHIPTEYVRDVYDKIIDASAPHRIRDIGYRAVETLRLEKQYLAWAADMRSEDTPFEVGLGFCVALDKPDLLAGPALRAGGRERRLRWFTTDADVVMHGGEMLVHTPSDTRVSVRSAGFGHTIGLTTFSASLPAGLDAVDGFEVEVANRRYPALRLDGPLYDPKGERIRA